MKMKMLDKRCTQAGQVVVGAVQQAVAASGVYRGEEVDVSSFFYYIFCEVSRRFCCLASPSYDPERQPGGVPRYGWYRHGALYLCFPNQILPDLGCC